MEHTHKDLVNIAEKWLIRRCGFAFKELATIGNEIPDAIGFKSTYTILIECKVNRNDFLNDKKKIFSYLLASNEKESKINLIFSCISL